MFTGFGSVSMTDAIWRDDESSIADFQAGSVPALDDIQCCSSFWLLEGEDVLTWEKPPELENQRVKYEIDVTRIGIGGPDEEHVVHEERFEYHGCSVNVPSKCVTHACSLTAKLAIRITAGLGSTYGLSSRVRCWVYGGDIVTSRFRKRHHATDPRSSTPASAPDTNQDAVVVPA